MRAAKYRGNGGPEVIELTEVPAPEPGPGQVLIEVTAAGLNRADVMQRIGAYPPPKGTTEIPGLEVSGHVVGTTDDVGANLVGREVVALLSGGGYAEQVCVDARHVLPVPDGVGLVDAAGLIEVAATVHSNLISEAQIRPGDTVLIHGGTGGIGSFACQLLRAMDVTTATTVGSTEKADLAFRLGADHVINHRQEDFEQRLDEITSGRGADVILDVVGAKYLEQNLRSLAVGGRMVVIGLQGGRKAEIDLGRMLSRRLRIIATTLRSRDADDKANILRSVGEDIWPRIAAGEIAVQTDQVFDLAEAQQAHEHFDSGQHTGKVLLRMR